MRFLVMDTNVLVSGFLRSDAPPGILLNEVVALSLCVVLDSRIFLEYRDVLARPRFGFSSAVTEPVLALIKARGKWISPTRYNGSLEDEGDRPFVESALMENVPVVTGNRKHFMNIPGLVILSPAEAVEETIKSAK